jgi:hypothetical protein
VNFYVLSTESEIPFFFFFFFFSFFQSSCFRQPLIKFDFKEENSSYENEIQSQQTSPSRMQCEQSGITAVVVLYFYISRSSLPLYFIVPTVESEEYNLRNSLLCIFLPSLLATLFHRTIYLLQHECFQISSLYSCLRVRGLKSVQKQIYVYYYYYYYYYCCCCCCCCCCIFRPQFLRAAIAQ